ncbi:MULTISPECIES: helix-turn-helix domain-containing protein [Streptomyces]|uniref:helix-turn-helix domain-containing protein n=1 Tax=Streptomyces TaxID=1883 RepID=UPI001F365CC2|nr:MULTISPECIES: helix-turn-helix domain-containing protein [Streptomyces]MDI6412231.1 helix-turn-helix domain-containing protein [Streptomyces albus]
MPRRAGGRPLPAAAEGTRRDTRGIVEAPELLARVRFRRRPAAPALRRWVEHYWLIDWDLTQPYVAQVVPHPCVNVVFERRGPAGLAPGAGVVAGPASELFTTKLEGVGRVCGIQFRPGGFRPFLTPPRPLTTLTGGQLPLPAVFGDGEAVTAAPSRVLDPTSEDARVAALDGFLLSLSPVADPQADRAMALAGRIRHDRSVRRVEELAADEGLSVRALQRLFAAYVGIGPKQAILRYRVHEALEHATEHRTTDWAALASELGYSDQAHLVRDFTAAVGLTPAAYAARCGGGATSRHDGHEGEPAAGRQVPHS